MAQMTLREWWVRVTSSKYTRGLEAEIARLRGENRALLNSILGIAGVPPVMVNSADLPAAGSNTDAALGANGNVPVRAARPLSASGAGHGAGQAAGPVMRRRSWQQIYRALELESARKKEVGDTV
jgi:hypothetical protein